MIYNVNYLGLRKGAGQGPVGASRVEVKQLLDELEAKVGITLV